MGNDQIVSSLKPIYGSTPFDHLLEQIGLAKYENNMFQKINAPKIGYENNMINQATAFFFKELKILK